MAELNARAATPAPSRRERLARRLWSGLVAALVPLALARLWWRGRRSPGYRERFAERFGAAPRLAPGAIWLHAVSLGETRAALPLIRALLARHPDRPLLVTTTTPTGSAQVREALGERVAHCYAPWDLPGACARFLDRAQPALAVIMETELWPNLFAACAARGVPLVVANARLSARSARGYARVPWLIRPTLAATTLIAAQAEADAGRFVALGAPRVGVSGNLKFDLALPEALPARAQALRRHWGAARPVWIGASTHAGEDELLLDAHARLRERWPELLLLLVPRHPERFDAVAALVQARGFALARRSHGETGQAAAVYLGDTMGELLLLAAASDAAFVGGSLVPTGGHNVLEPAALGVPVAWGPHMFNFAAAEQLLAGAGAGRQVSDAGALVQTLADWLADPALRARCGAAGAAVVAANRGALARLLERLDALLPPAAAP
ncbi:MAG TPA: lipid IV(A) 3-deoxy-D-manno-octulosonic acid transferase [Plasticicumulans sp.]|nr:lipid IV(A) 3-deoxy-D-manno-octulosonic acid transferase [Plasticicumulans sp.]